MCLNQKRLSLILLKELFKIETIPEVKPEMKKWMFALLAANLMTARALPMSTAETINA